MGKKEKNGAVAREKKRIVLRGGSVYVSRGGSILISVEELGTDLGQTWDK